MDESAPSLSLFQNIAEGGPLIILLYLLMVGAVLAVAWVRFSRSRRGGYAPSILPVVLAFAPLLFSSIGAFLCFFGIQSVLTSPMYGLTGPEGAIRTAERGYFILCTGWLSTAVALLIVFFPGGKKAA